MVRTKHDVSGDLYGHSVKQEVRNHSTTYRLRLNHHPNRMAISLLHEPTTRRRLKRYQPADLPTRLQLGHNEHPVVVHHRGYITGCTQCMSVSIPVNTAAECPRTYCRNPGRYKRKFKLKVNSASRSFNYTQI
jgi:hypothetical protein